MLNESIIFQRLMLSWYNGLVIEIYSSIYLGWLAAMQLCNDPSIDPAGKFMIKFCIPGTYGCFLFSFCIFLY